MAKARMKQDWEIGSGIMSAIANLFSRQFIPPSRFNPFTEQSEETLEELLNKVK